MKTMAREASMAAAANNNQRISNIKNNMAIM